MTIFLDSFSGEVANLKRGQRTHENVLSVLAKKPRVSTWDMSEHPWLCNIINDLITQGLIEEQNEPYPWHRYKVID